MVNVMNAVMNVVMNVVTKAHLERSSLRHQPAFGASVFSHSAMRSATILPGSLGSMPL